MGWAMAPVILAASACAAAAPGVRDPSVITVVIPGGDTWEVRRAPEVRRNQPVTVAPDKAWAVLPGIYVELGMDADAVDPRARTLKASQVRFSGRVFNRNVSDFFDCGLDPGLNRPLADQMPVSAQVVTEVLAVGATTELRTTTQATARRSGGNAGVASCRSTGLLEILIGEMVQRRASATAP